MLFLQRHVGHNVGVQQKKPKLIQKARTSMNPSNEAINSIFKSFNQIIWIVTSSHENHRGGLTATWVHQASIDIENPVVNIGLAPNHYTCELVSQSKRFGLHLLRPDQAEVAYQFAKPSGRDFDKFDGIDVLETELPLLIDCHTSFKCDVFSRTDAGDRIYFLADIIDFKQNSVGPTMKESDFFSQCSYEQIAQLKSDLSTDVAIQRPLLSSFRQHKSGTDDS